MTKTRALNPSLAQQVLSETLRDEEAEPVKGHVGSTIGKGGEFIPIEECRGREIELTLDTAPVPIGNSVQIDIQSHVSGATCKEVVFLHVGRQALHPQDLHAQNLVQIENLSVKISSYK